MTFQPAIILMADDDPDDVFLVQAAFKKSRLANELHVVKDGVELMDYLKGREPFADRTLAPRPHLILLDLNMPRKDGRQALKEIREDPELRNIPVVVLTTSKAQEDVLHSYGDGANSFITKPVSFDSMCGVIGNLGNYWFQIVTLPDA